MKKLFKLKEWLTLEETARRLTTSFQEEVSIADCLQLALDGHIIISALIEKNRYGMWAEKRSPLSKDLLAGFNKFLLEKGMLKENPHVLDDAVEAISNRMPIRMSRYGEVFRLETGIYDLPMIGAEVLDVLHLCSIHQGREPATFINLDGPFLIDDERYISIVEPFIEKAVGYKMDDAGKLRLFDEKRKEFVTPDNYHSSFYPADGLRDVEFVFRRVNIEQFEKQQLDEYTDLNLNESLFVIGAIIDALKNTSTKSKRWTQDSLKLEIVENTENIKSRTLDNYFSESNKYYKSSR
ncbi:hypothetical protein EXT66_10040 [Pectobacterium carotovorum subsp. carotovorum]|nr:hypothetical protein [Pectobacterium carotovorum]MCL6334562.1 hypothetical protein [Pectobacterium carotovorum subsp. carotovorum]MCL6347764.1 hypothetical protein [Pectobacterium carotovorum subsp. carotovorum]MCL6401604.1 hypothetical protein [Pectobacterium carotovorum subsp. carotovorum]